MTDQDLVARLLALPDAAAQKAFLLEHASLLDERVADALKEQVNRFLRSDLSRSFQSAELLLEMGEWTDNPLHRPLGSLAEASARSIGAGEHQRALELYDQAAEIYRVTGCVVREARSPSWR